MHGGNAIDAAVATAATLNVVEPMMVGVACDLFAIIYIAKDHKVYVLNASGTAPSGATARAIPWLGYRWNPRNWGPGSGMPMNGILPVTVPGAVWGWEARASGVSASSRSRRSLEPPRNTPRTAFRYPSASRRLDVAEGAAAQGMLHASSIRTRSRPGI